MKLYTLQECYEANGKKFPFVVDWYDETPTYGTVLNCVIIGFYEGDETKFEHEPDKRLDLGFPGVQRFFRDNNVDPKFDYKGPQYRKEFEEMIHD